MPTEDNGIGERLKSAREMAGMSRRDLSLLAGLAQAVVGMIERNPNTKPTADTMIRLAETLGVSLDWLLGGDEERAPTAEAVIAAVEKARAAQAA